MSQTPICDSLRALAKAVADRVPPGVDLYSLMKLEVPQYVFDRLSLELMDCRQWVSMHRDVGQTYSITVGWIQVRPFKHT